MGKKKLRKIRVDGLPYLWVFRGSTVRKDTEYIDYECHDEFIAYAEGYKNSPVRIRFVTWDSPVSGGPLRDGGPLLLDDPERCRANLNTPKWAAFLIRLAIQQGWQTQAKPLVLENGVALLLENLPALI